MLIFLKHVSRLFFIYAQLKVVHISQTPVIREASKYDGDMPYWQKSQLEGTPIG